MAIALDTSGRNDVAASTSFSFSYTCTGSNLVLVVVFGTSGGATSHISSVTYAGVTMTQIDDKNFIGDGHSYAYYLIAPATGANNVIITTDGTALDMTVESISYTGAAQSGQPDNFAYNTASATANFVESVTTVADNCWVVFYADNDGGYIISMSAGATARQLAASPNHIVNGLGDSNGAIHPAGSASGTVTRVVNNWAGWAISIAPDVPAVIAVDDSFIMFN